MDPRRRNLISSTFAVAIALAVPSCTNGGDTQPPATDAAIVAPECQSQSALIGRCRVTTGGDCTGIPDEDRELVELNAGDSVPLVTGPQGSSMFVLAVRTSGIEPGDPENPASTNNPTVTITLIDGGQAEMAHYRGRPAFVSDATAPGSVVAAGLFVVVEQSASELSGETVIADLHIIDALGEQRCGTLSFTAQ